MRIEHAIAIARPPDEVFAYLTDVERLPDWQESCIEAEREGEGPVGAGARWREVRSAAGRRIQSRCEVVAHEPGRRFDIRSSAPVPFTVRHTLEPAAAGTRLAVVGEGDTSRLPRLARPMVERIARRQFHSDLERLKRMLEERAPS